MKKLPLLFGLCTTCTRAGVLSPLGPVGAGERIILLDAAAIMLAVGIPTMLCTLGFAWWYRASNAKARYRPDFRYSGQLELLVWSVPALVVMFLGGIAWVGSHDLDPAKPLSADPATLEVDVVALDWKWLFIYPNQHIATVNQLIVPSAVPLHFRLTSATVMNSFFVPGLGSQIYAMAGMTTDLNLKADAPGHFAGLSAQFSGDGFSDMGFAVTALPRAAFDVWAGHTRDGDGALDAAAYAALAADPKPANPAAYGWVVPNLFEDIVTLQRPRASGGR